MIQGKSITSLMNSTLNCTCKPILHQLFRDLCDIGFREEFNTEFPHQVMNFPLKLLLKVTFLCTSQTFLHNLKSAEVVENNNVFEYQT